MIKAVVFVTLLGIAIVANGQMCNKVVCGTPETGKCASFKTEGKTWTIKACTSAQKCNIAGFQGATTAATCDEYKKPEAPTETKRSPGFSCTTVAGCYSGICTGNICQGLTKESTTDCVTWTASPSTANEKALCGANLYCKDKKCVDGSTTTCSDTVPCAYPKRCNGGTCIDIGSVKATDACTISLDCADGNYCDTTCKATIAFTKGKLGSPCGADTDCAGGTTTCSCTGAPTNTEGKGACTGTGTYGSTASLNAERAFWKGVTASKCPLLVKDVDGACLPTYTPPSGGTFSRGDCYGTFRFGTTNASADFLPAKPKPDNDNDGGSSSTKIVASVVGFLAYFLF